MEQIASTVLGGTSLGVTLALVALGSVLVFRATHTFNFAHGELMVIPALLVGRWQASGDTPLPVAIIAACLVSVAIAVVFQRLVLARLIGQPLFIPVIATLGLSLGLTGALGALIGLQPSSISVPILPDGKATILGAQVATSSLVLMVVGLIIALATAAALKATHVGVMIRAAGQDPLLASQGGVAVGWVYVASWAMAGALAGVAGIIYGAQNVASPSLAGVALLAFPAMLLGGLDSIYGAIVGGLVVGLIQATTATYWDGGFTDLTTYAILLVVLLLRPNGLFGTKAVTRL